MVPMTTKRIPKKPDEFRVWIKYQLELRGSSFAHIGRTLGISRQAVRKSILKPSNRLMKAISAELGIRSEKLWPGRHAA